MKLPISKIVRVKRRISYSAEKLERKAPRTFKDTSTSRIRNPSVNSRSSSEIELIAKSPVGPFFRTSDIAPKRTRIRSYMARLLRMRRKKGVCRKNTTRSCGTRLCQAICPRSLRRRKYSITVHWSRFISTIWNADKPWKHAPVTGSPEITGVVNPPLHA